MKLTAMGNHTMGKSTSRNFRASFSKLMKQVLPHFYTFLHLLSFPPLLRRFLPLADYGLLLPSRFPLVADCGSPPTSPFYLLAE